MLTSALEIQHLRLLQSTLLDIEEDFLWIQESKFNNVPLSPSALRHQSTLKLVCFIFCLTTSFDWRISNR